MTKKRPEVVASTDNVDAYISQCPEDIQRKLKQIRAAIKEVAPGAIETTSYFDIPGYSYPGYDYNGMFAWFSFQNSFIGLHVRPPTIENHKKEVAGYATTKAIVKFPCDSPVPVPLVRKLVKASIALMKGKK